MNIVTFVVSSRMDVSHAIICLKYLWYLLLADHDTLWNSNGSHSFFPSSLVLPQWHLLSTHYMPFKCVFLFLPHNKPLMRVSLLSSPNLTGQRARPGQAKYWVQTKNSSWVLSVVVFLSCKIHPEERNTLLSCF